MDPRRTAFAIGDLALLVTTSALAAGIVAMVHAAIGVFILAALAGMVAGMTAQMLLAAAAAVVLGSIETMVPTMIAGMAATGFVCVVGLIVPMSHGQATGLGAAAGLTTFAALAWYGSCCHRRFARRLW